LKHLEPTALTNTEFSQAANPGRLAADLSYIGPLSGVEHVQRE
jgi:hypothetical protein